MASGPNATCLPLSAWIAWTSLTSSVELAGSTLTINCQIKICKPFCAASATCWRSVSFSRPLRVAHLAVGVFHHLALLLVDLLNLVVRAKFFGKQSVYGYFLISFSHDLRRAIFQSSLWKATRAWSPDLRRRKQPRPNRTAAFLFAQHGAHRFGGPCWDTRKGVPVPSAGRPTQHGLPPLLGRMGGRFQNLFRRSPHGW